jgi:hypothetical protein
MNGALLLLAVLAVPYLALNVRRAVAAPLLEEERDAIAGA